MFVPLLLVMFRVIRDTDGVQLTPPEATKHVLVQSMLYFGD